MKITLTPPNAQDKHYLIDVKKFMRVVDPDDLECRDSKIIHDSYHEHWFRGQLFLPPVFYLTKGVARFINGRHRTLVMIKHMDQIPMALANMDGYPNFTETPHQLSRKVLRHISLARLNGKEEFIFPDLPITYFGFDLNLGK